MYVYIQTEFAGRDAEHSLYTVGFYRPTDSGWVAESDHNTAEAAAARVAFLNGGIPVLLRRQAE